MRFKVQINKEYIFSTECRKSACFGTKHLVVVGAENRAKFQTQHRAFSH